MSYHFPLTKECLCQVLFTAIDLVVLEKIIKFCQMISHMIISSDNTGTSISYPVTLEFSLLFENLNRNNFWTVSSRALTFHVTRPFRGYQYFFLPFDLDLWVWPSCDIVAVSDLKKMIFLLHGKYQKVKKGRVIHYCS